MNSAARGSVLKPSLMRPELEMPFLLAARLAPALFVYNALVKDKPLSYVVSAD